MKDYKNIYFVGIGGSGMSALAKLIRDLDIKVSGSDKAESEMTELLEKEGIKVFIGHDRDNLTDDIDCVVYTIAASEGNPEILKAKEKNIPIFTYAQMLGEFSRENFTIAVSGTHGKTTTTAMIGDVFIGNNRKPYIIVGSILNKYNSNYVKGSEKTFVVEACEYKKSFLNLSPDILVITNIDLDHLDFYKNIEEVQDAFEELIDKMSDDGVIICNPDDQNISKVIKNKKQKIVDYSKFKQDVPENILGEHNISNAAVSLTVSDYMKFNSTESVMALSEFEGTKRRFQCKGTTDNGALIYDDYAHHPTAITLTINTLLNRFKDKKIVIIFQPHTYSRTKGLFDEFVKSLQGVSEIIILPIYAAREKEDVSVSSEMLVQEISKTQKVKYCQDFDSTVTYLDDKNNSDYLIMTMGAGDVYRIGEKLI